MNKLFVLVVVVALMCATGADDDEKEEKKGGKGGMGFKFDIKWTCKGKEIKMGDKSSYEAIGECSSKCKYDAMGAVKDGKLDEDALNKSIEKTLPKEVHDAAKKEIKTCVDEAKEGKSYFTGFTRCEMKALMKVCKPDKKDKKEEE